MGVAAVAPLHHGPVGLVAIHGDGHAAATGGDAVVPVPVALGVDLGQDRFGRLDVGQGRAGRHVPTIEQDVDPDPGHPGLGRGPEHGVEMVGVGVHPSIGVQAEEVQGVGPAPRQQVPPQLGAEERAVGQGPVHQLGPLGEDPSGPEGVVADLAVAHVVVARQTDRLPVGRQLGVAGACRQLVERRGRGLADRVGRAFGGDADTIGHDDQDRAGARGEAVVSAEGESHGVRILSTA